MTTDSPAYFNGAFLPLSQVSISPLDRGFLFGDGVYEVIPAYGRQCLALDAHLDRLADSLAGIALNNPHTHAQWRGILQRLVDAEPAIDKKLYLQVTRGVQVVRHHDFNGDEQATVFAMCSPQAAPTDAVLETGVSVYTQAEMRWAHCNLKAISLLPNILLKHASSQRGGAETLVLKGDRVIEGSSSNVFIVTGGVIHTPTIGTEILPGVTRTLLIDMAGALGFQVIQADVLLADLMRADEVWVSSSTRGVIAVTRVDDITIGDGRPGPVWKQLYDRYAQLLDSLRNG